MFQRIYFYNRKQQIYFSTYTLIANLSLKITSSLKSPLKKNNLKTVISATSYENVTLKGKYSTYDFLMNRSRVHKEQAVFSQSYIKLILFQKNRGRRKMLHVLTKNIHLSQIFIMSFFQNFKSE